MQKFVIGVDLGGTSSKMAILNLTGEAIVKWTVKTDSTNGGQNIVDDIINSIENKMLELSFQKANLKGIGMGSPGTINRTTGEIVGAYNLGWKTAQPVRQKLQNHFGDMPIILENDANAAAVGEQFAGAGNGADNMVLVTLGTGVGGGIIVDGQLVIGEGAAGEIGHMVANPDGIRCTCGNIGCLETIASATGIMGTAKEMAQISQVSSSTLLADVQAGEHFSTYDIFESAKMGDVFANQVVDETMKYLTISLSQIAHVIHPKYILIGGGVANAGDFLLEKIKHQFTDYGYPAIATAVEMRLASLGNDAGVLGAGALILANVNNK